MLERSFERYTVLGHDPYRSHTKVVQTLSIAPLIIFIFIVIRFYSSKHSMLILCFSYDIIVRIHYFYIHVLES